MRPSPAELLSPREESWKRKALTPWDGLSQEHEQINLSFAGGKLLGGPLPLWRPRSSLGQGHLCQPFLGSLLGKITHFSKKQMLFSLPAPPAPNCLESSQR